VRTGWQPGLPLELALAHAVEFDETAVDKEPARPAPPRVQAASRTEPVPARTETNEPAGAPTAAASKAPPKETSKVKPTVPEQKTTPEPAPVAETQTARTSAPSDEGGSPLNMILQNWSKIRALIKNKHKSTEGLLNSCRSITMHAGVLQLGFGSEVLKSKMETEDNLKITMKAIQHVLGVDIPVACVVVDSKGGPIQRDEDVDADGMVNAALNLGAKIVQKE